MNKFDIAGVIIAAIGGIVGWELVGVRDRFAPPESTEIAAESAKFHEGSPIELRCGDSDVYFFPRDATLQDKSDEAALKFARQEGCTWINQ